MQRKGSALRQVQEAEIRRVGKLAGLRVSGYSATRTRRLLCEDGKATKAVVARLLVERFPELARYLRNGSLRQPGYWLHIFDALAVEVVCGEAMKQHRKPQRAAA